MLAMVVGPHLLLMATPGVVGEGGGSVCLRVLAEHD